MAKGLSLDLGLRLKKECCVSFAKLALYVTIQYDLQQLI